MVTEYNHTSGDHGSDLVNYPLLHCEHVDLKNSHEVYAVNLTLLIHKIRPIHHH